MKHLHVLPRFNDRWSHLYLERGKLEKEHDALTLYDKDGATPLPIDQLSIVFLGPGTTITHAAVKALADNNCQLYWVGEEGVRLYAFGIGGTHSAHRLLRQAKLFSDEQERGRVVRRMYQKRFPGPIPADASIEQIRGMEGARVRESYRKLAETFNVEWHARAYDQNDWSKGDPLNRALSCANSCLYGLCHAAILAAGYSPAIGFVHVGKMLSFVYDIADLYKTELTVPAAFEMVASSTAEVERRVRQRCRDAFYHAKLMDKILPDIAEVLDAGDDLEERPGELEGRAVSLAGGAGDGGVLGEPERAGA
ncbi:MAG TPA: type I-E CRISPR-associated endonuclease Cas1e [Planctomycetota bacterium]|jgi:CRISPR-associated protein Cas1